MGAPCYYTTTAKCIRYKQNESLNNIDSFCLLVCLFVKVPEELWPLLAQHFQIYFGWGEVFSKSTK